MSVVIGVNERGEKRCLSIPDGVRESTQCWREVLLEMKAPKLAVGDGSFGVLSALDEIYSGTRHQRCWVQKNGERSQ